jgi:hypothetical protein
VVGVDLLAGSWLLGNGACSLRLTSTAPVTRGDVSVDASYDEVCELVPIIVGEPELIALSPTRDLDSLSGLSNGTSSACDFFLRSLHKPILSLLRR